MNKAAILCLYGWFYQSSESNAWTKHRFKVLTTLPFAVVSLISGFLQSHNSKATNQGEH